MGRRYPGFGLAEMPDVPARPGRRLHESEGLERGPAARRAATVLLGFSQGSRLRRKDGDALHHASGTGNRPARSSRHDSRRRPPTGAGTPSPPFQYAADRVCRNGPGAVRPLRRTLRHSGLHVRARRTLGEGYRARHVPTARHGDRRIAEQTSGQGDSHRRHGTRNGRRHRHRPALAERGSAILGWLMNGKPGFRVRASWPRPDAALLAAFGEASPAQIADCMSRLGAMDAGMRPIWASPRIIGPALTVWCHSGDNLMLHKALSLAQPGDVVVMNTQGNTANSGFGELLATSGVKMGVRGVILDGTVRDADALQALRLPVY